MPRGTRGIGILGPSRPIAPLRRAGAKGGRGVCSPADLPGRCPGKAGVPGHRNRNSPGVEERRAAWDAAASRISWDDLPMPECSTSTGRPPLRADRTGGILQTSPEGPSRPAPPRGPDILRKGL